MLEARSPRKAVGVAALGAAVAMVLALMVISFSGGGSHTELVSSPATKKTMSLALPTGLVQAQHAFNVASGHKNKQQMLAAEAKAALKKYAVLRKHARNVLATESRGVKSLVSNAARQLVAEEAVTDADAKRRKSRSYLPETTHHLSAAQEWTKRERLAEEAAKQAIWHRRPATHQAVSNWNSYVQQRLAAVKHMKEQLEHDKVAQDHHIHELMRSGRLEQKTKKVVTEHQLADRAAKAAAAHILRRDMEHRKALLQSKAQKARVQRIAHRMLPGMEHHLSKTASKVNPDSKYKSHLVKSKQTEAMRQAQWLHLVHSIKRRQRLDRKNAVKRLGVLNNAEKLADAKSETIAASHLAKQVGSIIHRSSPKAVAKETAKQHAAVEKAKLDAKVHGALRAHGKK